MIPIDWKDLAREHPTLEKIPKQLWDTARLRTFAKQQVLYRRGQLPEMMIFVLCGEVRLTRPVLSGAEIVLQRSRGGFVAEASLDTQAYHCDVVAATDGQLLLFPRGVFQTVLENDSDFNRYWICLLVREVRRLRAQSERLSLNRAADRIMHYIESEGSGGTIILQQTRKNWAAELGLTHEVLYRTLRQLCDRNVITIDGRTISLHS